MISPRAWRSPSLLGPLWCPEFSGSPIQRSRGSPLSAATCAESSVQPSPMTSSSKSENVCRSTLEIAWRRTLLQLYVGRMTVTCGFTPTAYRLPCGSATGRIQKDREDVSPQRHRGHRDLLSFCALCSLCLCGECRLQLRDCTPERAPNFAVCNSSIPD